MITELNRTIAESIGYFQMLIIFDHTAFLMKIISTNLGKRKTVTWRGKPVETGIFKEPVNHPIVLGKDDVEGDHVIDRKYHGGEHKACYLYSADHYPFWRQYYPDHEMQHGMFGENLTVEGLDESKLIVGDEYTIGTARVQISEPRQPCFKLGIRFEDQGILKRFIGTTYCGAYVRVLQPGEVKSGDKMEKVKSIKGGLSIAEIFSLIYDKKTQNGLVQRLMMDIQLRDKLRRELLAKHGIS